LVEDRFRPGAVVAKRKPKVGPVVLYLGKGPDGAMPPGQWRYLLVGEKF
jgi:23S rRNA pseudouridine2604 synthase